MEAKTASENFQGYLGFSWKREKIFRELIFYNFILSINTYLLQNENLKNIN